MFGSRCPGASRYSAMHLGIELLFLPQSRSHVTIVSSFPVPQDKGNVESGDEIAWERDFYAVHSMFFRRVRIYGCKQKSLSIYMFRSLGS